MPGTSFHSTTRRAPSTRASSVAVRSEPPRPRVVMLSSGARPMKPGTTGTTPFLSSGLRMRSDSSAVSPRFGAAPPWASSVRITSRASTNSAGRRAPAIAAETIVAESCSPRETRASRVRGARCRRTPSALHRSRYSSTDASIAASASRNALPRPSTVFAAAWWRSRKCPRDAGRFVIAAFDRVLGAVEQQIGDAAERRGHHDQRAVVGGNPSGRARDRLPVGQRRAAELPHFQTLLLSSRHHGDLLVLVLSLEVLSLGS